MALVSASALLGTTTRASAAEPSYPASPGSADLAGWVAGATGLRPGQVVYANAESIFAVTSTKGEGALRSAEVRGEALTPEVAARTGAVSVRMHLDLDCAKGLVRAGATLGYANRDAQGASVLLALADPQWRRPVRGGPLDRAWGYVCLAQRGPLANAPVHASALPRPRPAPPPRTGVVAQLASAPTEAGARTLIEGLAPRLSPPLSARIEPAQVQGRSVYRVVVEGFASPVAARAYCEGAQRRSGRACFIRVQTRPASAPRPIAGATGPSAADPRS